MSTEPILYLDIDGFHACPDQKRIEALRQQYLEKKHFFLDEFLSPKMLEICMNLMGKLDDSILTYTDGCQEERIKTTAGSNLIKKLCFIYSNKQLLQTIGYITGLQNLIYVTCRMYYVEPDAFHDWHEDSTIKNRKLVMITNLSKELEGCGKFQLRRKGEQELLADKAFSKLGETLCFGVDEGKLEHRVLPSVGIRRMNLLASFYGS